MDFDFDSNDIKQSKQGSNDQAPLTEDSVAAALQASFIALPSRDLLPSIINAIHQLKLPLDEFIQALDHFTTTKSTHLSESTLKQFVQKEQIDSYGGLDLDNFHEFGSYDREIDRASTTAAKKASIVSSKGKAQQNYDEPSFDMVSPLSSITPVDSKPTTASILRSHHLTPRSVTKRSNAIGNRHTTSGRRRSQWTPLLASPSSAFPEHHQKGQVLVRFAPRRKEASNTNVSGNFTPLTSLPDTTPSASGASQSTRMFDAVDSLTNPASHQSNPTAVPVYVLSWIHHARNERRRQQAAKLQGVVFQPPAILDLNDPLKTDNKPFRYMDWNHQVALGMAVHRERELAQDLIAAQAYTKGLETLGVFKKTKGSATTAMAEDEGAGEDNDDEMPQFCENFTQQQVRITWYFGHIANTATKDSKLSNSTLILSNYVSECPLRIIHKELKHFSFFPGQVVVCRGTNVTGNAITPDLILTESSLEKYTRKRWISAFWALVFGQAHKKQQLAAQNAISSSSSTTTTTTTRKSLFGQSEPTPSKPTPSAAPSNVSTTLVPSVDELNQVVTDRPVKVMYCAGPFVSAKGSATSLASILEYLNDELTVPDVLIISGPFVDVDSPNSILRPVHSTSQEPHQIQVDYYTNHSPHNNNTTTTTTTTSTTATATRPHPNKTEISLCNVATFKSDVFAKYLATPQSTASLTTGMTSMDDPVSPLSSTPNLSPDGDEGTSSVSLYKDLFAETMTHIVSTLNSNPLTQNITLITIPSTRDIHHYPCYPQPGYEYQYQPPTPYAPNSVKVINAPNPCQIDINGVLFAATTNDVVAELSKYELFVQKASADDHHHMSPFQGTPSTSTNHQSAAPSTPSKPHDELVQLGSNFSPPVPTTPGTTPNPSNLANRGVCSKDKRTIRLISHILSQQSFAPISTMPSNPTIRNARTSLDLLCKPDVLLLPSKLRFFIESVPLPGQLSSNQHIADPSADFQQEHGHVLAINPNSTILGENLGSFAALTIYNDRVSNQPDQTDNIDVIDRVHAEIIHL